MCLRVIPSQLIGALVSIQITRLADCQHVLLPRGKIVGGVTKPVASRPPNDQLASHGRQASHPSRFPIYK